MRGRLEARAASTSGRAEASGAARALWQRRHFCELDLLHALHDQLGDAVAASERDRRRRVVVDQDHADLAAVTRVDEAGCVDETQPVAEREAGAGHDESRVTRRQRDGEPSVDDGARARSERHRRARVEIESGVVGAGVGRQRQVGIETLNEDADGSAQRFESARSRSVCTTQLARRRTTSAVS